MKYLSTTDVEKMKTINNFSPVFLTEIGTIEWRNAESELIIYATPNWKTEGTCPFAYSIGVSGKHTNVTTLEFKDMSIDIQIEKYIETVKKIIVEYGE